MNNEEGKAVGIDFSFDQSSSEQKGNNVVAQVWTGCLDTDFLMIMVISVYFDKKVKEPLERKQRHQE